VVVVVRLVGVGAELVGAVLVGAGPAVWTVDPHAPAASTRANTPATSFTCFFPTPVKGSAKP
jgi:hypothetical protein